MSVPLEDKLSIPQLRQVFKELKASPAVTAAIRNVTRNEAEITRSHAPMTAMIEPSQAGGFPQMTVERALKRLTQIAQSNPQAAMTIRERLKSELALKQ